MQKQEKAEFSKSILATAEIYKENPSKGVIDLYFAALKDLTLDQIAEGIARHVNDPDRGRFMPKPADIRAALVPAKVDPLIAWREVEDAICKSGSYATVYFADEVTTAVIRDMGGWIWICEQNIDEPWIQKEFERRYKLYQDQGIRVRGRLPGRFEIENTNKGYLEYVPDPICIGSGEFQHQIANGCEPRKQISAGMQSIDEIVKDIKLIN